MNRLLRFACLGRNKGNIQDSRLLDGNELGYESLSSPHHRILLTIVCMYVRAVLHRLVMDVSNAHSKYEYLS